MVLVVGMVVYFLLMLFIGAVASKKVKTADDYLVAKRRLPFLIAMPTIVATWFGAGSCLGVSGMVYQGSFYDVIADPFAIACALLVAGIFFASPFRKTGKLTISDILNTHYGPKVEKIASILTLPFYIGTLASQMLAIGIIFHITTGLNTELGIMLGSVIVIVYTMVGGMWAVSCTDVIQLVLLIVGLVILFCITWRAAPLADTLPQFWREFSTLKPQKFGFLSYLAFIGQLLMTGLGAIMGQDLIQRFFSCRTPTIAKWSAITGSGVYLLLGFIPLFIGVAGRFLYPNLGNAEQLLPQLARDYLSPTVFMLFAIGLIAAIMSTADSYLLAATAILTQNIINRRSLKTLRLGNLLIAVTAFIVAVFSKSIFNLMVHSGAMLFVAIFFPTTIALFWKKASCYPQAALSSMALGTLTWLGWVFLGKTPELTFEEHLFAAATAGAIGSCIGYVVVVFRVWCIARYELHLRKIGGDQR